MKKLKVFYNGKRLKDVYPYATRFQVFKYRVAQFFSKLFKLSVVGGLMYATFILGTYSQATSYVQAELTDSMPIRVEKLKQEVIEQIAKLETGNVKTEDGLVHIDNNKAKTLKEKDIPSYGCMQFKVSTVQLYEKNLYKKDMNNYDAILVALDCSKAKQLAEDIIFKVNGGLWNWSVATKEMGMKVEIIKSLEK